MARIDLQSSNVALELYKNIRVARMWPTGNAKLNVAPRCPRCGILDVADVRLNCMKAYVGNPL